MGIEFEKIKLRDYQQEAIDNMYELLMKEKDLLQYYCQLVVEKLMLHLMLWQEK